MPLDISYEEVLEKATKVLYPEARERRIVQEQLRIYGSKSFHRDVARVRLGILYLTSQDPSRFDDHLQLACHDYRDLLCAAEYPYSSQPWNLREKSPEKYKELQAREMAEYLDWVATIETAGLTGGEADE